MSIAGFMCLRLDGVEVLRFHAPCASVPIQGKRFVLVTESILEMLFTAQAFTLCFDTISSHTVMFSSPSRLQDSYVRSVELK